MAVQCDLRPALGRDEVLVQCRSPENISGMLSVSQTFNLPKHRILRRPAVVKMAA